MSVKIKLNWNQQLALNLKVDRKKAKEGARRAPVAGFPSNVVEALFPKPYSEERYGFGYTGPLYLEVHKPEEMVEMMEIGGHPQFNIRSVSRIFNSFREKLGVSDDIGPAAMNAKSV